MLQSILLAVMRKVEHRRKILYTNTVNFSDPAPSLNVKTVSTMSCQEKCMLRLQMTRLLLDSADNDLFGRPHIAANTLQINLKEALCYELSPIPCALAYQDGNLWKTYKSIDNNKKFISN